MNLEFGREGWAAEGFESSHVTTKAMGLDDSTKERSADRREERSQDGALGHANIWEKRRSLPRQLKRNVL